MADPSIKVRETDWLEIDKLALAPDVKATADEIVKIPTLTVDVEIQLPASPKLEAAKKAVQKVVAEYKKLFRKQLETALPLVVEQYKADQTGKAGAHEAAEGFLGKANKYIESALEDIRVDMRKAAAKETGANAKDLMSVGKVSFKELTLVRGKFGTEVEYVKREQVGADLNDAFKKKKWQFCGVVFGTRQSLVAVDPKREIKVSDLKKLKNNLPPGDAGGASFVKGRVVAFSGADVVFEFLEKSKSKLPGNANATRPVIKRALEEQTKKKFCVVVRVVSEYTEQLESKGEASEDDDTPKSKKGAETKKKKK